MFLSIELSPEEHVVNGKNIHTVYDKKFTKLKMLNVNVICNVYYQKCCEGLGFPFSFSNTFKHSSFC